MLSEVDVQNFVRNLTDQVLDRQVDDISIGFNLKLQMFTNVQMACFIF